MSRRDTKAYTPTSDDEKRDTRAFCLGLVLTTIGALIAWQLSLAAGVVFAVLVYARTGNYLCQRILIIRSQLGPLIRKDAGLGSIWFFVWPMMWVLILHDDFPIMTGREATLVRSQSWVTNWLEQGAAASRWQLGDGNGRPRRRNERYQISS